MQNETHFRKPRCELRNHLGQHVPRLRMGRRDGEHARVLGTEFVGDPLQVADFPQRPPRRRNDHFPRGRERCQALPLAYEHADAKLVLELPHLLADAGLRRIKRFGCFGHIEAVVDDRAKVFELLQIHAVYNRTAAKGLDYMIGLPLARR